MGGEEPWTRHGIRDHAGQGDALTAPSRISPLLKGDEPAKGCNEAGCRPTNVFSINYSVSVTATVLATVLYEWY